mgnify:CR=1 FL=1
MKVFIILNICFVSLLGYSTHLGFLTFSSLTGSVVFAIINLICIPIVMVFLLKVYLSILTNHNVSKNGAHS